MGAKQFHSVAISPTGLLAVFAAISQHICSKEGGEARWIPQNELQEQLLSILASNELVLPPGTVALASYEHALLARKLKEFGSNIQLPPFMFPSVGAVSLVEAILSWAKSGVSGHYLRIGGEHVECVELKELQFVTMPRDPNRADAVRIPVSSPDWEVTLIRHKPGTQPSALGLLGTTAEELSRVNRGTWEQGTAIVPMVNLGFKPNLEPLLGAQLSDSSGGLSFLEQEIRIQLNAYGLKARAVTAGVAMRSGGGGMPKVVKLDGTFILVVTYKGKVQFTSFVAPDAMQDPGRGGANPPVEVLDTTPVPVAPASGTPVVVKAPKVVTPVEDTASAALNGTTDQKPAVVQFVF